MGIKNEKQIIIIEIFSISNMLIDRIDINCSRKYYFSFETSGYTYQKNVNRIVN